MDHSHLCSISILFLISIAVISFLTSCTALPTTTPIPTPQIIDLYYSPALDYLRGYISSCVSTLGTLAPYLIEKSAEFTKLQPGDIVFRLGEAEWNDSDYFVTQIDSQNILFITNDANPTEEISIQELKAIFAGMQSSWNDEPLFGEITSVWTYPDGSELEDWLKEILIGSSSLGLTRKLAPNPSAMLEAVGSDETAIGYLPDAYLKNPEQQLVDRINILEIENIEEELLPLPVLAYLKEKPDGAVREFLLCLQNQ